jgi:choline dehydrogenase-like flavoprotein
MDCVLGSGPAAVACAEELLRAGRKVVMIDPGRRLSSDRINLVDSFRDRPDPEGFVARMRALRAELPRELRSKKLPFCSPHVFQDVERVLPINAKRASITRSLATGGLSTMWGATVMPFSARSFRDWPVTLEEMAPFYRRAAGLIDVPTVHDDLDAIFPNFGNAAPTAVSEQGAQLMSNLLNNRRRLAADGISFGRCRSAIGAMYASTEEGCVYCGLCMYGCPYKAIFSAEYVVERLKTRPDFHHRENWIAETFEEGASGVAVRLRHLDSGGAETLNCERLFVACGASTSLRLVAGAMKWFDETFHLLDTQLVTIPAFLRDRSRIGPVPRANAFGQVFVEFDDPELCDELIHLQIYGFNPFIADLLRARWGKFYPGDKLLQPLFDRMMMVMVYLPAQLSAKVAVRISAPGKDHIGLPIADFTGEPNPRTRTAMRGIGRMLKTHRRAFGWLPLLAMGETVDPGVSNHLASGLPMRQAPGLRDSDRLGRPGGLQRVHVVDGACFSDLPGEHLTYTIMANAARIAAQSTEEIAS